MTNRRNILIVVGIIVVLAVAVVVVAVVTSSGGGPKHRSEPQPSSSAPPSSGASSAPPPSLPPAKLSVPKFSTAGTPTAAQRAVLARRVGFGEGVTGGAGATPIMVSNDADSGAGSLRAAVAGNSPKWIEFAKDMTIQLRSPLAIGSNTTIDGTGHDVQITGPNVQGLDVIGVSNVIIESLTLHDFGNVKRTKQNNLPDAIHIDHAHGVWVDHCDLSMAGDKLIGVTTGSTGISVTWTHFHDQEQTFQIGNQSTAAQDVSQDVTVAYNFFDRTTFRNPVVDYGRVHVFNNYYLGWKLYGVRAERTGQIYLQDNIFRPTTNKRAAVVVPARGGCNDAKTHCDDRPGVIKASGNLLLDDAKLKDAASGPGPVFDPSKFYKADVMTASESLARSIAAKAGPRT